MSEIMYFEICFRKSRYGGFGMKVDGVVNEQIGPWIIIICWSWVMVAWEFIVLFFLYILDIFHKNFNKWKNLCIFLDKWEIDFFTDWELWVKNISINALKIFFNFYWSIIDI